MRTVALAAVALVAFAANSILCRLALGSGAADAATFSTVRVAAGAAVLLLLVGRRTTPARGPRGSWTSAACLCLYAVGFSFAYLSLAAGTGALVLFGAVQVTMMMAALVSGERPQLLQWFGLAMAIAGFIYLVLPGLAAPSPVGAALMTLAGVGWGLYSLRGRRLDDPLAHTAGNFIRAVPIVVVVSVLAIAQAHASLEGLALAAVSGAVTSGLGYAVWYAAIRDMTATRAAVIQLSVPVLAAAGGLAFLGERISMRLVVAGVLVLGGIGAALAGHERANPFIQLSEDV